MKRLIPLFVLVGASRGSSRDHRRRIQQRPPGLTNRGRHSPPAARMGRLRRPAARAGTGGGSALALRATKLGNVLVDAKGRSLYLFEATSRNEQLLGRVPEHLAISHLESKPQAKGGVSAAKLGTIAAPGAKQQVTYNGHPLYYYVGDRKPGDTTGQGLNQFGAEWYVLAATATRSTMASPGTAQLCAGARGTRRRPSPSRATLARLAASSARLRCSGSESITSSSTTSTPIRRSPRSARCSL